MNLNNNIEFDPLECEPISKKSMVIFFLVDNSGSMAGTKLGSINTVMEEIIPKLRGVGGATTDVKLAVMSFSDECKWITPEPISIDEYQCWERLKPEGLTSMGEAFRELSSKLSRSEFLKSPSLSYAPVIFLITDGLATDDAISGLKVLKNNKWYKYALKVSCGISIDSDSEYIKPYDEEILEKFTGNRELVFDAPTSEQLEKLVKTIVVTSSQIGSKSVTLVDNDGQERREEDVTGIKEDKLTDEIKTIMNEPGDGTWDPVDPIDDNDIEW